MIIAIDGPAGTGKGTVAKLIADRLGFLYIDTGAMYRAITLKLLRMNVLKEDIEEVKRIVDETSLIFKEVDSVQGIYMDGEDVSKLIRTPEVTRNVSSFSAILFIRQKLVQLQREIARNVNVIMEGRDITTVVFPNADVKIYLTADLKVRAMRRFLELGGKELSYEEVLKDIKDRDKSDMEKEYGALKIAEGAIIVDSTDMSIEQVYDRILNIIKDKEVKE